MADVDEQMRRLYLAGWLTRRASAAVGGSIDADASRASLEASAAGLARLTRDALPFVGLHFDPPYPGHVVDAGGKTSPERLVLECTANLGGDPFGVVLTVLIPGRRPEVSVAPPGTATG